MLLGRASERRQVKNLLDAARHGQSQVLVIAGEPGIGKSALLDQAADDADGFAVLRVRAVESEDELPFAGLAELLRSITGYLSEIPEPQRAALAGAFGLGPRVPADPFTTFLGTFSLLAAAAERQPVLVAVDDAQWLDRSSQDALMFVARRLQAEGIVLLLAMRADTVGPTAAGLPSMQLRGLDPAAAGRLLRRTTVGPIADQVVTRLVEETSANPLALLELSQSLSPAQLGGHDRLPDPLPIGPNLRPLYLGRLSRLPEATRRALLIASVAGSGNVAEIVAALRVIDLDLHALDPAEAAGVIRIGAELEFAHPLVRAAIYHDATGRARREAHRALAEVLTGDEDSARRAWHLASATIGTDETVAGMIEAAARDAASRGAHSVAAATFERAAALSPAAGGRVPRLLAAAMEHVLAGQSAQALPVLEDARGRTPDDPARADIDHLLGRVLMNTGPLTRSVEVLADAAHRLEPAMPDKASSMLTDAALACFIGGRTRVGESLVREAHALTGGRDDGPGEATHMLFTGILVLSGQAAEAAGHVDRERRRIAAMHEAGQWQPLLLGSIWLMWAEEHDLARKVLDGGIAEARRLAAIGLLPLPLAQRSELAWRVGDWNLAYASAAEAVRLARDTGQQSFLSYALACQAQIAAGLGREAECRAAATEATDLARPIGSESTLSRVEAALGLLELGAGQFVEAERHLRAAHDLLEEHGVGEPTVVPYMGDLIEALLRTARPAEAIDIVDGVERRVGDGARLWTRAILARARGMTASEDAFGAQFEQALRWHDRVPGRFDRARTLLAFGERLRRSGHRLRSRERLREALREFEYLGASAWASRARAELRASGDATAPGTEPRLVELTPQELQIAMAVAGGLTNREAAASLFLSPKTIEFHLGNVYSKLSLRSRTELVRVVATARA